jgi:hypothetical protein
MFPAKAVESQFFTIFLTREIAILTNKKQERIKQILFVIGQKITGVWKSFFVKT